MNETMTAGTRPARTTGRAVEEEGRLLVGFDGSAAALTALEWAVSRALTTGREVHLVGVVDDDAGAMGMAYADHSAREHARLLSEQAARLRSAHVGLVVTTRLVEGPVALGLAGAAHGSDVLVIGSDKTGYARGRLYGVRSVQLAALVPGTLVVVPSADLRLRDGVVVALDGTPASVALARAGAHEASSRGCRLSLIHSVALDAPSGRRRQGDDVLRDALQVVHSVDPGLEVTRHIANRRPAEALLNLARDRALLLVGRSRRTPSPGVGGTLHEVLINANVPVMVVP